jgi:hypothetical protein
MENSERRGTAIVVRAAAEDDSHAEPPVGEVISRQVLGEIPLRGGDKIVVSWVRFSDREPILSVWFHRPGHDGQWWPIRDKGIRLGARRLRAFLEAVAAAAPLEADWRRHSARYGRRDARPPRTTSEELRRDNERRFP